MNNCVRCDFNVPEKHALTANAYEGRDAIAKKAPAETNNPPKM